MLQRRACSITLLNHFFLSSLDYGIEISELVAVYGDIAHLASVHAIMANCCATIDASYAETQIGVRTNTELVKKKTNKTKIVP